jgi:tetratricopeptide (TPR) repeat protein
VSVAVFVLLWVLIGHRFMASLRAELPPLPPLADCPPALVRQLTQADARARREPRSGEAVGHLAKVYHANAFDDPARVAYRLAVRIDPGEYRWPYFLAVLEMNAGQNATARALLTRAPELNPDYAHAWVRLGQLRFRAGMHEEAEEALRRAVQLAPTHPHGVVELVRVLELREAWSEAATLLERAVRANPGFAPAHRYLALAYEHLGRPDDAHRHEGRGNDLRINDDLMNELFAISSTGSILLTRAKMAESWGELGRSEQLLRRAVLVDPEDKDVRIALGRLLTTWGTDGLKQVPESRLQEAKRHLEAGLAIDPAYARTRYEYGVALRALGDVEGAVDQWNQVLRGEPEHAPSLMMLGQVQVDNKDYEKARESFRRGLNVPRDTPFTLGNRAAGYERLGLVCSWTGRMEEALEAFRQALDANPRLTDAYMHCARVLKQLNRGDEAIAVYRRGVFENPGAQELRMRLGNELLQAQRFNEALEQLTLAARMRPEDARALSAMGYAKLRLGDADGAIGDLRAALNADPTFHLAHFHLGNAMLRKNDRQAALRHFEEALRLQPSFGPAREALTRLAEP